jgi:hypothetical protein
MDGFMRGGLNTPPEWMAGGQGAEPRRNRDSLFLLARVRVGGEDEWSDVRVRNLSAGGLMAEIATALPIDSALELELRGIGKVRGRVAWQAEGRTGVAFDAEIDPMKARKPVGKGRDTTRG